MKHFRPPGAVIWLVAAVLFAGGAAYIGRGLSLPWQTNQDIDLKLRNDEHAIFAERIYPHGLVTALLTAFVAASLPGTGWFLIAKLTVACLLYAALLFAFNEWRPTRQQLGALRSALAPRT